MNNFLIVDIDSDDLIFEGTSLIFYLEWLLQKIQKILEKKTTILTNFSKTALRMTIVQSILIEFENCISFFISEVQAISIPISK